MLTDYLLKEVRIMIDRPLGSRHPNYPDLIYPVNYGFLPGTVSGDGEEIDAYLLSIDFPVREFTGIVAAVVHRKNDEEDKLVVAPKPKLFERDEIARLLSFQERFFDSEILMPDDGPF